MGEAAVHLQAWAGQPQEEAVGHLQHLQLPREAVVHLQPQGGAAAPLQPRGQAVALEARAVLQAVAAALLLMPRACTMVFDTGMRNRARNAASIARGHHRTHSDVTNQEGCLAHGTKPSRRVAGKGALLPVAAALPVSTATASHSKAGTALPALSCAWACEAEPPRYGLS